MKTKDKEVIIFNKEKIRWTFIDVDAFLKLLNNNGIKYLQLSEVNESIHLDDYSGDLNEKYKSISLYDVCIYNICNELQIFKNEICLSKHNKIIVKWFSLAKKTIDYLEFIFRNNNVVGAIIFHGHLMFEACLLALSKINNVKFLSLENTSNKDRIVWEDLTGYVVNFNLSKNYFYRYNKTIDTALIDTYCDGFILNKHKTKREEHVSNKINKALPFEKPYLLYLGQVYNDASQLFTLGDGFKNPIDIIKESFIISKDLGIKLIVKLHPKEVSSQDPVTKKNYNEPSFSRLIDLVNEENIFIDRNNELDTFNLIEHSLVVITVNSQAGVESCLYNKPVFTYYKSFYSSLGFTYDYVDKRDLKNKINYVLKNKILTNRSYSTAKSFFYIFFERYCIKRGHKDLFNKIVDIFDLSLENKPNNQVFYKKMLSKIKRGFKIFIK